MNELRFELNRQADEQLAKAVAMKAAMTKVADEITEDMERRAPDMIRSTGTFSTDAEKGTSGWAGLAIVKSPFWHWAEFGTAGHHFRSPQPFIRPAGQSVISRMGGRWKPS